MAANFDWQKYKGKAIKLLLNKHPYADAMLMNIENFKKLTGLDVTYDIFPEDVYFDKVTTALSSKSSGYDAFMTGAYQTWQYGPAGWLVDLNEFIKDPAATSPDWNVGDILPGLLHSDAWSGVPGRAARRSQRQAMGAAVGLRARTRSPTTSACSRKPSSIRRRTCPT